MSDVAGYWARQMAMPPWPPFSSAEVSARQRASIDAIVDSHRGRSIKETGRVMLRADLGLPEPVPPSYAFWLGKEG